MAAVIVPTMKPLVKALMRSLQVAFNPLSLFANGESGAWYDPSDLTTLFQDGAGTTPVTADGDPVGLMLDKSGNGNHASQSATGAKPIYRTDGELHWLEFDGTKRMFTGTLSSPVFTTSTGMFAAAASSSNPEAFGPLLTEHTLVLDSSRVILTADTRATPRRLAIYSPAASSSNVDRLAEWDGAKQVMVCASSTGAILRGYVNGVEDGSTAVTGDFAVDTRLDIGWQAVGDFFFEGNFYGAIARSTESNATDISKITQYLADKAGVTL